ncbi:hypothetical protein FN846DRAFT_891662 [Sphaerosporella brunnea]|nr:hypothetical protein FN846DRAFT_891662 [Sphaerosporella brunnea]
MAGTDAEGKTTTDTDPAAMVELVLSEAQKRKREASSALRQQQNHRNTLPVPGTSTSGSHREPGGWGRATSPTRSFLIPGRSASSAGVSTKRCMPSPPPQQPATPGRPSFPTPVLSSLQFGTADSDSKRRWSLGRDQLRELQREYKFSEATLQRTLKAKQALELSAIFKKLLEIEEERVEKLTVLEGPGNSADKKTYEYNPLRVIRNRKIRSRKKIQLDVSPWEDPGTVEQWVEDAAVSGYSPSGIEAGSLPRPPPGVGRKLKRPKMDWIIEPQEMFADYYWMRSEDCKREGRRSIKSIESLGKQRASLEVPDTDFGYRPSDDDVSGRVSTESPRKRRTIVGTKDYHQFFKQGHDGFESAGTSSDGGGDSNSEYLNYSSDTDEPNRHKPDDSRHRRRRNKLERMIRGRSHDKKKSKKLKQHQLELEERRRKREAEDNEWILSETDEKHPVPVANNQPEYRQSMDIDEEYESAPPGWDPSKRAGRTVMGVSTAFGSGSRSSLERYPTPPGLGISGSVADRSDFVVPSIAISLSPPRMRSEEPDAKDDDRRDNRASPTKKLLSGMRRETGSKEKESVEDSGRESLDIERCYRRPTDKEKSSKVGKVRSRVDKLRNEVSRVEELLLWKRGDGAMASPTASSFTASDDEDRNNPTKEGTSELEDHELSKRASAAEVPMSKKPKLLRHSSTYYTSHRDRFFRRSFDSDREASPEQRGRKLWESSFIPSTTRERSPARNVKFDSFRRKAEDHLALTRLRAFEPPHQQYIDAPEEPLKQSSLQLSLQASSFTASNRDIHRARTSLIASGILIRRINASAPPVFNPRLRAINTKGNRIDALLQNYSKKQDDFNHVTAPRYHGQINRVNKSVAHTLTPMVRSIADEADGLSARVTNELALNVKKLQDEIFTLARRRKGRGKMRLVRKVLWGSLEWIVVVLMWVVWSVFLVFRIVRGIVGCAVKIVRWVLWL